MPLCMPRLSWVHLYPGSLRLLACSKVTWGWGCGRRNMQPDAAPLEKCASPSRVMCAACVFPQFVQHTCRASGSWQTPQGAVRGAGRCQGQLLGTIRAASSPFHFLHAVSGARAGPVAAGGHQPGAVCGHGPRGCGAHGGLAAEASRRHAQAVHQGEGYAVALWHILPRLSHLSHTARQSRLSVMA